MGPDDRWSSFLGHLLTLPRLREVQIWGWYRPEEYHDPETHGSGAIANLPPLEIYAETRHDIIAQINGLLELCRAF